ncbi:MAG: glycine cleavage system protein GcvH [Smithellaceae bacterium]|nr:glycine cleavage system protein GcvH [Smithellaceae bacterium]
MQIENWQIKEELKYDNNNFWVEIKNRQALIGLSDYGQWVIGDILYIELGSEGAQIQKGESCGSVESGKWVGNLIAPVSGRILESNSAAVENPLQIQTDPYGAGWLMRVALESGDESRSLLDSTAYAEFVKEQVKNAV